jgi:hypothetical protein
VKIVRADLSTTLPVEKPALQNHCNCNGTGLKTRRYKI